MKRNTMTAIAVVVAQTFPTKSDLSIFCIGSVSLFALAKLSSFSVWDLMELIGSGLVIAGCWGEFKADFSRISKCENAKERLSKCSTLVLIVGLVIELAGFLSNLQISQALNLSQQTRISTNELQVAQLTLTNITLRTKLVDLELKVQPRRITPEQVTNFVFLTQKIAKIPITVSIGQEGFDTEVFAFHLREMFSKAGFGAKYGAGALAILRDPTRLYVRSIGTSAFGADVILVLPSAEVFARFETNRFNIELVHGVGRPIVTSTNEEDVYTALNFVLKEVGVTSAYWQSQWTPPRAFEIFVPLKEQF